MSAKIRELLTEEKVNELMVSWLQSLRSESKSQCFGCGGFSRRGRPIPVTEPAARPRRWWKIVLIALAAALTLAVLGLWYTTTAILPKLRPLAGWWRKLSG